MSQLPGVIFDMDGVIVHSNPTHKAAIQKLCSNHNQEVSKSFIENQLFGRTNEEWIPDLFGHINKDKLKELADEKEQLFRNNFKPENHIVQGIYEFLETLKENNIPMAVATSAPPENADYILSRLNISHYFDAVLNSSHVTSGKPEPEIYLKAAKAIDKKPTNCIVFEDSVSGVAAGRNAEATVVGVSTIHNEEELSPCSLVINDFREITFSMLLSLAPQ